MKIMTFNTQHCHSYLGNSIDIELMARVIKDSGADIVGLNEIYGKGDAFPFEDQTGRLAELTSLENRYFAKAIDVHSWNSPYGNALISKYPIISAETIPVPDPDANCRIGNRSYETRCLLKAKLSCGLTVLIIHFGLNPEEKENAVKTVLENIEDEKCILMGDFNITPDEAFLAPIKARMKDSAEIFEGERLSYPSDTPIKKIDYIFVSHDIELISADIPSIVASDHRPHTAEIRF